MKNANCTKAHVLEQQKDGEQEQEQGQQRMSQADAPESRSA
jgi:hypothetical protein